MFWNISWNKYFIQKKSESLTKGCQMTQRCSYNSHEKTHNVTLTEGGGDSRPIRGVFSQREFWKLAFCALLN